MSGGFVRSWAGAVMTTGIVAGHTSNRGVVKQYLQPVRGVMAQVTRLTGGNVIGAFAAGDGAVMTIGAKIRGLRMINGNRKRPPSRAGGMAAFTSIRCLWMSGGFIAGIGSGMTGVAIVAGLTVVKRQYGGQPGSGAMTCLAAFRGLRMGGRFIGSGAGPVVTPRCVTSLAVHRAVIKH